MPADYASPSYLTISELLPRLEKGKDARIEEVIQSLDAIKNKEDEERSNYKKWPEEDNL